LGNQPKALSSVCGIIAHRWQQSPYKLHTGIAQHFFMATGFPSAQYGNNRHQTRCSIVSIPLPMVHSKNKGKNCKPKQKRQLQKDCFECATCTLQQKYLIRSFPAYLQVSQRQSFGDTKVTISTVTSVKTMLNHARER